MSVIILLIIFIIASVLGYIFERNIMKNTQCGSRFIKKLTGKCFPAYAIYGTGAILIVLMNSYMREYNIFTRSLVQTGVITLMECIGGKLSEEIYGKRGWEYDDPLTFCDGYISMGVSSGWFVAILLFNFVLEKINIY